MPENKVKFGLKKCYYAVITENDGAFSYGTPVAIPGAVSLAANKSGDSEAFEADDKDFWVVSSAQYDITLEVAKLPESFFTDVLMYAKTKRYISGKRLYEFEALLGSGFMRISKSTIVNLHQLDCLELTLGGLMLLILKNGCKDYISRKYLPAFKKYLGL